MTQQELWLPDVHTALYRVEQLVQNAETLPNVWALHKAALDLKFYVDLLNNNVYHRLQAMKDNLPQ